MKARCISFVVDGATTAKATVVLTPSWLARLFGARTVSVELCRSPIGWRAAGTDRDLGHIPHGSLIENALDFSEVERKPRRCWALGCGTEAVAP